ncbi:hypothetical protein B7P33_04450 [Sediminicola luteus]|uniref:Uncharacterized protein n=2 Tax=Sediminicola luteus TaxID=319238 RepID=A0A2A4GFP2_9FLAO|nr:hypothetical protein B7P33_04450 [Sediminicola luteus]
MVIDGRRFFNKLFVILIWLTCALALYEFISKSYIFIVYRETVFGFQALDEKLFGGVAGIFRSKVFFEGPLALSQFCMGASLFYRKHIKILIPIFLTAIFANGRLGILVCGIIIFAYLYQRYNIATLIKRPWVMILVTFAVLGFMISGILLLDAASIERFKEVFDTHNAGNNARIEYWINGISTYFNYDLNHLVFGNNGYFLQVYKNNAENGWITLLLNNGIVGFIYYLFPILLLFARNFLRLNSDFIFVVILLFCMFVQTFHLGASANLFYWLIIYSLYRPYAFESKK